jgi:hypothetical protein
LTQHDTAARQELRQLTSLILLDCLWFADGKRIFAAKEGQTTVNKSDAASEKIAREVGVGGTAPSSASKRRCGIHTPMKLWVTAFPWADRLLPTLFMG